jgi:hypothetical protein
VVELPAVVTLLCLALAVGAALGAWCVLRFGSPPLPAGVPLAPALLLAPPLPPAPAPLPPVPPGLLGRFLGPARAAAEAMHEARGEDPEETAQILAQLAADHWSLGVGELRQALITHSALTPALAEVLAERAIVALEARHALGPRPRA